MPKLTGSLFFSNENPMIGLVVQSEPDREDKMKVQVLVLCQGKLLKRGITTSISRQNLLDGYYFVPRSSLRRAQVEALSVG